MENKIIHQNQRGFRPGKACRNNIVDLIHVIQQAKQKEQRNRKEKIPVNKRQRTFVLFIDLKKAFDKVNRQHLLNKMERYGFAGNLIDAIENLIMDTEVIVDGKRYPTELGVP